MQSSIHGNVSDVDVLNIMKQYIIDNGFDNSYKIIIGTDSQNRHDTKVVLVIALINVGHGGIYFYRIKHVPRINIVTQKILFETQTSIEYANHILDLFTKYFDEKFIEKVKLEFIIHVDAGSNGKSKDVISDVINWVNCSGFQCEIKPNSFVASTIADKISK